jgi:Type-IV b secretion system, inner-membrane complex component
MKNVLMALFCAGAALAASAAWAQQDVPSAAAPAVAVPAATVPATTAAPAPATKSLLSLWHPYGDEQNSQNNLANSNHTLDEILNWAQQTAADVLSFSPDDRATKMESFQKKYFVKQGWGLYLAYLHDSHIEDMVEREGYFASTIVPNIPQIYSTGAKDGAYHWIVKMPITIGFYKKSASPTADPQAGPSGKFILYIDVMRVASGGEDGVAITNWQVTAAPK